jgi:hypothetical protein
MFFIYLILAAIVSWFWAAALFYIIGDIALHWGEPPDPYHSDPNRTAAIAVAVVLTIIIWMLLKGMGL